MLSILHVGVGVGVGFVVCGLCREGRKGQLKENLKVSLGAYNSE
jgi:hypothetical protein